MLFLHRRGCLVEDEVLEGENGRKGKDEPRWGSEKIGRAAGDRDLPKALLGGSLPLLVVPPL